MNLSMLYPTNQKDKLRQRKGSYELAKHNKRILIQLDLCMPSYISGSKILHFLETTNILNQGQRMKKIAK